MDYREFADHVIAELTAETPSYKNCEMLSWMYAVRKHYGDDRFPSSLHEDNHGHSSIAPLDREMAMEWAKGMENADGTRGAHWTIEQTEEYRAKRGIDSDPLKWWLAMNMIYSDYCKAAEKVNANSLDFYVYMAKAFLDDRDAEPDKLARYYWAIVRK